MLAEPEDAGLLVSGTGQDRKADGSPASSHPAFKPHPIQGWCVTSRPPRTARILPPSRPLTPLPRHPPSSASRPPTPSSSPRPSHPLAAHAPLPSRRRRTPDFIPKVLDDSPDGLRDVLMPIPAAGAISTSKALASKEGLLTGISGGGTMWAALETAKTAPKGSVILAMLPDTGERYLSTPLFAEIAADMDEAELEIAKSTPSFQLLPDAEPVLQM